MYKQKKKQRGITLISLVISIIVMLILAGVALSAVIGDNGIITQAQTATVMSKFAGYMEEFELNKVSAMIENGYEEDFIVNILGTDPEFLKFIPSIPEEERENFEIIAGHLVYKGTDEFTKNIALSVGMKDEFNQEIYDTIGKEFEYYITSFYNAVETNQLPASKYEAWKTKDIVLMNEFSEYAKIPDAKYTNEFELQYGIIAYNGTNEDRLTLLANSQYLKQYIVEGKFLLPNYIPPVDVGDLTKYKETEYYKMLDWIVRIDSINGSMMYGTILGYAGSATSISILNIPDTFNVIDNGVSKIVKITTIQGDGTNNIFNTENTNVEQAVTVQKVVLAKNISKIIDKGLANIGDNVQLHIQYVGSDLILGNDKSDTNVVGYEGIENTCGSFIFVVPQDGNYTFKLWGASGGSGQSVYSEIQGSSSGLGGYSQGTVNLKKDEKIYCYIGGKGLYGSSTMEDGSGGYNGGGSGLKNNSNYGYAGGGSTDIRYGGSKVTQSDEDYRILVAGGGGGSDNAGAQKRGNGEFVSDDGTGGNGGGTVNSDKTSWNGSMGYIDGRLNVYTNKANCSNLDIWYFNEIISEDVDGEIVEKVNGSPCPGGWDDTMNPKGAIYDSTTREVTKFWGQGATVRGAHGGTFNDHAGGGSGYYGGECSIHHNGGAAGGSAYADLTGIIKQVTDIQGYSGITDGNGAEMLGRFGNGKIIISK